MKVSALPADQQLNLTDRVLIDDEGGTKTATIQQLKDAIGGGGSSEARYTIGTMVSTDNGFVGIVGYPMIAVTPPMTLKRRFGIASFQSGSMRWGFVETDDATGSVLSISPSTSDYKYDLLAGRSYLMTPYYSNQYAAHSYVYAGLYDCDNLKQLLSVTVWANQVASTGWVMLLTEDLLIFAPTHADNGQYYYDVQTGSKYHMFVA